MRADSRGPPELIEFVAVGKMTKLISPRISKAYGPHEWIRRERLSADHRRFVARSLHSNSSDHLVFLVRKILRGYLGEIGRFVVRTLGQPTFDTCRNIPRVNHCNRK